jgi:hypothetical protein
VNIITYTVRAVMFGMLARSRLLVWWGGRSPDIFSSSSARCATAGTAGTTIADAIALQKEDVHIDARDKFIFFWAR